MPATFGPSRDILYRTLFCAPSWVVNGYCQTSVSGIINPELNEVNGSVEYYSRSGMAWLKQMYRVFYIYRRRRVFCGGETRMVYYLNNNVGVRD